MPKRLYLSTWQEKTMCSERNRIGVSKRHNTLGLQLLAGGKTTAMDLAVHRQAIDGRLCERGSQGDSAEGQAARLTVVVQLALNLGVVLELQMVLTDGNRLNAALAASCWLA